jgi:hypothetical protein
MNKKMFLYQFLFLGLLFFCVNPTQAITILNPVAENQDGGIVFDENSISDLDTIADIGLYDAEIIEQSKEKLKIYFEIKNNDSKTHSDLVYAVELIEKIDGPIGISRAKKIYKEKINLVENQKIEKEIEFEIPPYLSGDFEVSISLADINGLILAINSANKVSLESQSSFVEIKMQKCYLTVEGESEDQKYSMMEGMAVDKNENLIVNCEVENHFSETKELIPRLGFYKRSLYGDKIDLELNINEKFIFGPSETKLIQFTLDKPDKPQAYSASLDLVENKNVVSNQVEVHFVVSGPSATIQSISLDKNYYKKGDKLGLNLLFSGPADNFSNSRTEKTKLNDIFTEIFIVNSDNNQECVFIKDTVSSNYPIAEYSDLETLNDCYNPQVTVVLRDEKDNILAERTVKVESQIKNLEKEENIAFEKQEEDKKLVLILIISLSFVVFVISGALLLRRVINKN